MFVALALSGCAAEAENQCVFVEPIGPDLREGDAPFGLVRCDVRPDLCELPVESEIREPDLALAIDLVFVGDGFSADALDDYRDRVRSLVDGARADPLGILARDPERFNVHRVDVTSASEGRALGSCTERSPIDGRRLLQNDEDAVRRAAANAPDADVVIVLTRSSGVANAGLVLDVPRVVMQDRDSHRVLTHELGHALFGLGDEYVQVDRLHPAAESGDARSDARLNPNVSLDPSEDWGGLLDGALEGAAQYGRGVYRPTDECRMRDSESDAPFCPVCADRIDTWLAEQRAGTPSLPTCIVSVDRDRTNAKLIAWDSAGVETLSLFLDDGDALVVTARPCPACRAPRFHRSDFRLNDPPGRVRLECVDTSGARSEARLVLTP